MSEAIYIDPASRIKFERALKELSKIFDDKTLRKILRRGARTFIKAAKQNAPVSSRIHHRYSTVKLLKRVKAPNGRGNIVASYAPGNLKRSIRVLPMRRLKRAVLIGPKKSRNPKGMFAGRRTDAYYAPWVEFGTEKAKPAPFIFPAWQATKTIVQRDILRDLRTLILQRTPTV